MIAAESKVDDPNNRECGNKFADINTATDSVDATKAYYDRMAENYRENVQKWGYNMPEQSVEMFLKNCNMRIEDGKSHLRVLDLACGDGLVGIELKKKLDSWVEQLGIEFNLELFGADLSTGMLDLCKQLKRDQDIQLYNDLHQADLGDSEQFRELFSGTEADVTFCIGSNSYFEKKPEILQTWLLACKRHGYIIFTSKTVVWEFWEPYQEKLCEEKIWEKIAVSSDLNYLPGFKPDDNDRERFEKERVRIYVYQKLV